MVMHGAMLFIVPATWNLPVLSRVAEELRVFFFRKGLVSLAAEEGVGAWFAQKLECSFLGKAQLVPNSHPFAGQVGRSVQQGVIWHDGGDLTDRVA